MRELCIAVLSVVFFVIVMPILDSFSNFIQSFFNKKVTKWQMELNKEQKNLEEDEEENRFTQAIGFEVPDNPDESEIYCNDKRKRN